MLPNKPGNTTGCQVRVRVRVGYSIWYIFHLSCLLARTEGVDYIMRDLIMP